jgi:uncharacterized membrane protein
VDLGGSHLHIRPGLVVPLLLLLLAGHRAAQLLLLLLLAIALVGLLPPVVVLAVGASAAIIARIIISTSRRRASVVAVRCAGEAPRLGLRLVLRLQRQLQGSELVQVPLPGGAASSRRR